MSSKRSPVDSGPWGLTLSIFPTGLKTPYILFLHNPSDQPPHISNRPNRLIALWLGPRVRCPSGIASKTIRASSSSLIRAAWAVALSRPSGVYRPCSVATFLIRANPSAVFAPVDRPPWFRQTLLPLTAGLAH